MALIKCKECGKEISDTLKQCINCGYENKQKKISTKKNFKELTKEEKQKIYETMKRQNITTNEQSINILSIFCVIDIMLILLTNNIWLMLLLFCLLIGLFIEMKKANKLAKQFYESNEVDL